MHKIDRYGVIALVFMAVTFLAVYFWDDHGKSRTTNQKDARGDTARVEPRPDGKPPAPGHSQALEKRGTALPLSPNDAPALHANARTDSSRTDAPKKEAGALTNPMPATLDAGEKSSPSAAAGDDRRVAQGDAPQDGTLVRPEDRRTAPHDAIELAAARESLDATKETGTLRARDGEHARAAESTTPTTRAYTVARGDTLEGIAARELGSRQRWGEIQAMNGGLDPKKLWVGKVLQLPAGKHASDAAAVPTVEHAKEAPRTVETAANTRTYVVKKGDILGTIAQKELGSAKAVPRIAALNPGMDPNHLVPGMKLVLPAGTAPKTNVPLELSTGSSRKVARLEPRPEGSFKVR
jgi:nucleoid-associated protein YgaU